MPPANLAPDEKKEELSKQIVEDLMIIAELEQRPIKHFKADKNGIFYEVQVDSEDHYSSTK